jgi:hypothetical protein
MDRPDMERPTDPRERSRDLHVAVVVDAHEAELDKSSAVRHLGFDDLTGIL